jgi:hypothetical protein
MEVHRISREISPSSMHITCPWPCQGAPRGRGRVREVGGNANRKMEDEGDSGYVCFSIYLSLSLSLLTLAYPSSISLNITLSLSFMFTYISPSLSLLPYSLAAAESSLSCSSSPTTSLSSLSSLAGKWNRAMRRPPRLLSHLLRGQGEGRKGLGRKVVGGQVVEMFGEGNRGQGYGCGGRCKEDKRYALEDGVRIGEEKF